MPNFLIDADTPHAIAALLRQNGLDALHVREIGMGTTSDKEIFLYARSENRIIISRDLGWSNLKNYPAGTHPGFIVIRVPPTFTAKQITAIFQSFLTDVNLATVEGALTIIEPGRYRIRQSST